MNSLKELSEGQRINLLIGFYDIKRFAALSRSMEPQDVFGILKQVAAAAAEKIGAAGGIIIKYIGDAALFVFPEDRADQAVTAILQLKAEQERLLAQRGWDTTLTYTLHFGEVMVGKLPPIDAWDIIGEAVSIAATLDRGSNRGSFVITPQAFRKLDKATRKLFHKHTPPVVYVGA